MASPVSHTSPGKEKLAEAGVPVSVNGEFPGELSSG